MQERVGDAAIQPQESATPQEILEEILEDEEEAQNPSEDKKGSPVKAKSPCQYGKAPQLPQMELEEPIQELRRTTRKIKPNPRYANIDFVDEPILIELSSYEEASKGPQRRMVMEEEIKELNNNQTWDLVARTNEVKSISCK